MYHASEAYPPSFGNAFPALKFFPMLKLSPRVQLLERFGKVGAIAIDINQPFLAAVDVGSNEYSDLEVAFPPFLKNKFEGIPSG